MLNSDTELVPVYFVCFPTCQLLGSKARKHTSQLITASYETLLSNIWYYNMTSSTLWSTVSVYDYHSVDNRPAISARTYPTRIEVTAIYVSLTKNLLRLFCWMCLFIYAWGKGERVQLTSFTALPWAITPHNCHNLTQTIWGTTKANKKVILPIESKQVPQGREWLTRVS